MTSSNVPIGGVVCFLALVFLRLENTDNPNRRLPFKTKILHMDLLGAITLVAAICCLLLALQWGGTTLPWKSSKIIGLLIGFGILLIIFGALQWKFGEKATIPLRILRQRSILSGCCFTFLLNMSVYTVRFSILMTPCFNVQTSSFATSLPIICPSISKQYKVSQPQLVASASYLLLFQRCSQPLLPALLSQ